MTTKVYISVLELGNGWAGVLIIEDENGFPEPWQTSILRFKTREEAIIDAKQWAEAEELNFKE